MTIIVLVEQTIGLEKITIFFGTITTFLLTIIAFFLRAKFTQLDDIATAVNHHTTQLAVHKLEIDTLKENNNHH